jgi:hypothetical protein
MATQHDATFYRAALLLGLVPGEHVVAWADQVIHHEPHPPVEIYVVAMTPAGDLTRLRDALLPLAQETESPDVVRELLGIVARDLNDGRRNVEDTMRVLTQARRLLPVPADWERAIDSLVDDHMLATAGVGGDLDEIGARARAWLARFAAAE